MRLSDWCLAVFLAISAFILSIPFVLLICVLFGMLK